MKQFKAGANKIFKQLLCLALCAVMLLGLLPPLEASAAKIKNSSIVKDPKADIYALTPGLEETLNKIFNGDINLFSDSKHKHKVSAKMNSQPVQSGTTRYITSAHATPDKTKDVSGQTCSIYAMAIYSTLFGATVFNQKAYKSTTILSAGGQETDGWGKEKYLFTYEHFVEWGVSFGAFIRTTRDTAKKKSTEGHSMIVLAYDENELVTLEGNYNGDGRVNVLHISWDSYKTRPQRYARYIVQPTPEYFAELYPDEIYSAENRVEDIQKIRDETISCTINYNANSGDGAPPAQKGVFGKEITLSPYRPIRWGYNFLGWSTNPDAVYADYHPGDSLVLNGDLTLYAVWSKAEPRTITYDANGGSGAPSAQTGPKGFDIQISDVVPTRSGYIFQGWTDNKLSTVVKYKPGDTFTLTDNVILYAIWEIAKYTITYDANGGINTPSAQTCNAGTETTLSSEIPDKTGCTFLGWSENRAASSAQYAPGAKLTLTKDMTLYAVWKANTYTLRYDANGGEGAPDPQSGEYGSTIKLSSAVPTKADYIFQGWAESSGAVTAAYQPGSDYVISNDTTLYAVWLSNDSCIIRFDANGGENAPDSLVVTRGETISLTMKTPTKANCYFAGWSEKTDAVSPDYYYGDDYTVTGNVTLYAVWNEISNDGNCGAQGDNLKWKYSEDGVLTIYGQGEMRNFTSGYETPWASLDYKTVIVESGVTSLGDFAFGTDYGFNDMTSASLPDTLKTIGKYAFAHCWLLNSVEIPYGVTSIGEHAFDYCRFMSFDIPGSVKTIGAYAFTGIGSSFTLHEGLEVIGEYAFSGDHQNTTMMSDIPSTVKEIGYLAFQNVALMSGTITIPAKVTGVSQYGEIVPIDRSNLFERDTDFHRSIQIINVAPGNKTYSSSDGVLYNAAQTHLIWFPEGRVNPTYTIPSTVSSIDTIECDNLQNIEVAGGNTTYASIDGMLCSADKKTLILCPAAKTEAILPASITTISSGAFSNGNYYSDIQSITILNPACDIQSLGGATFRTVIHGYTGSTAQTYAEEYGYTFEALDGARTMSLETLLQPVIPGQTYAPWSLDENGLLTISSDWTGLTAPVPWAEQNEAITAIILEESVSTVGIDAFAACSALRDVTVQNLNCELGESSATLGKPEMTVIHGYSGSTAETYAEKYGYVFEPLDAEVIEDSASKEIVKPEDAEVPPDSSEVVDEANETLDLQAEALETNDLDETSAEEAEITENALLSVNTDNPAEFEEKKDEVSEFPSDTPDLDAADDIPESSIEAPVTGTQEDEESTITGALQAAIPEEPETGKINDPEANEDDNP